MIYQMLKSLSFYYKMFHCVFFGKKMQKAFTLIEIMVVLALAGILFGLAAPSWQQAQQHQRLIEAVEQVELDLYDAFSAARNINQRTQFLASGRGKSSYSIITDTSVIVLLPAGITFATEGNFTFVSPYGNIHPIPSNTELWIQNDRQKTGLKIYPKSGLIERLPVRNIQALEALNMDES
jgi:prepilin-type N-terminal cleavage/methylation domain-containing protein